MTHIVAGGFPQILAIMNLGGDSLFPHGPLVIHPPNDLLHLPTCVTLDNVFICLFCFVRYFCLVGWF